MKYLPVSTDSLAQAAEVIRLGGIVAFPTETVYGLGADAYNPAALVKIFEAKGRPRFDPLIIHIAALESLEEAADLSLLSGDARRRLFLLAENLWPGPLSIVLPKSGKIPGIATAGLSTAAIRFPANEAARSLISLSGTAIAAPSANPFGSLSPTRAEHVRNGLGDKVDIILDGGCAQIGLESTVLDLTEASIKILRPGGTPKEAIENLIGPVENGSPVIQDIAGGDAANFHNGFSSPGQLKSHYSPKTPLSVFFTGEISRLPCEKNAAFLFFDDSSRDLWQKSHTEADKNPVIKVLSPSGKLSEAASCLFEALHELDSLKVSRIFAQFAPEEGIGAAINDRLKRAGS